MPKIITDMRNETKHETCSSCWSYSRNFFFLFLNFPLEEDILRQKYIRLKVFSIKFSKKKILIVEAVNATVEALPSEF